MMTEVFDKPDRLIRLFLVKIKGLFFQPFYNIYQPVAGIQINEMGE